MILAIFELQVTPLLPTKFQVNWPFGSGEEAKIDFQDGCHLGFLIQMILSIFDASYKVLIGLLVQEKKRKTDFQDGRHGSQFISNQNDFSFFFSFFFFFVF